MEGGRRTGRWEKNGKEEEEREGAYHGEAMSMGERTPVALLDFGASARLAVATR